MSPNDICPTVFWGMTKLGDAVGVALHNCIKHWAGELPQHIHFLSSSSNLESCAQPALVATLNARNRLWLDKGRPRLPVWTVIAVSAVELGNPDCLRPHAAAVRRRMRRARIAGRLALLVYTGGEDNALPSPSLLRQLDNVRDFDVVFLIDDCDARGRFLDAQDVVNAAARILFYFLCSDAVRELVTRQRRNGEPVRTSLGIGCVDLRDHGLVTHLQQVLRQRVVDWLFQNSPSGERFEVTAPLKSDLLSSLICSGDGAFSVVDDALESAASSATQTLQEAQLEQTAERTRQALEGLLPEPPPDRPNLWHRFRRWLQQRKASSHQPRGDGSSPLAGSSLHQLNRQSVEIERVRLGLLAVKAGIEESYIETDPPPFAFHFVAADESTVQRACEDELPDPRPIAWRLSRELTEKDILADPRRLTNVAARITELCAAAVPKGRLLQADHYRELAGQTGALIAPLFPGPGVTTERLVLLPPGLRSTFKFADYPSAAGNDDEVVFIVARSGVRFESLGRDEESANDAEG